MKHITYGDKAILVGDDAADALLEFARVVADQGRADTVTLLGISPDGNTVEASFLLSSSATLMIETTNSDVQPPENDGTVADIRDRIRAITRPARADADDSWASTDPDLSDIL